MIRFTAGLLLVGLVSTPSGHAQPIPQTPAYVTLSELQGTTIHASWTYAARFRNANGEFTGGVTSRLQTKLGPDGTIKGVQNETRWANTPRGRKSQQLTRSSNGKIGVPRKNNEGTATAVWLFEDGTLTRLGVVKVGGGVLQIKFTKTASGLTCSASITQAREVGAGNRVDTAGGTVEVLGARPVGTPTCRVVGGRTH